jgi:hypothetical protein
VQGDESFIEFGSGRGQLTYWIVKSTKSSRYFLVDRESHRHKFDNKLRDELPDAAVQRIRADILNLVLEEVPGIKNQSNVSALLVRNGHSRQIRKTRASHIFLKNGPWRVSANLESPCNTARRMSASLASTRQASWQMLAQACMIR